MRLLFLCHRFPHPPNEGGKIRAFYFLRHLAQTHEVVVASLAHSEEELSAGSELKKHCSEVIAEVLPDAERWRRATLAFAAGKSASLAYFWSPRLARRIEQAARERPFDAVVVHCAFAAPYWAGVRARFRLLDFCDLDSGKWFAYSRHRPFPLSAAYGLEARRLRRYERQVAAESHRCLVATQGELDTYRELGVSVPCKIVPNGVDLAYFRGRERGPANPPALVFVGKMNYYPNVDAVIYFAREILPLIRRSAPQTVLRIVGAFPSRQVRQLARMPGVVVTGRVPDVRSYLDDAAVAVVPLRIARGIQNKILEAMAVGVPVVTTSQAARGVEATPERHFLSADAPEKFAGQVLELLNNPSRRRELTEAARKHVETAYAWPRVLGLLDEALDSART